MLMVNITASEEIAEEMILPSFDCMAATLKNTKYTIISDNVFDAVSYDNRRVECVETIKDFKEMNYKQIRDHFVEKYGSGHYAECLVQQYKKDDEYFLMLIQEETMKKLEYDVSSNKHAAELASKSISFCNSVVRDGDLNNTIKILKERTPLLINSGTRIDLSWLNINLIISLVLLFKY